MFPSSNFLINIIIKPWNITNVDNNHVVYLVWFVVPTSYNLYFISCILNVIYCDTWRVSHKTPCFLNICHSIWTSSRYGLVDKNNKPCKLCRWLQIQSEHKLSNCILAPLKCQVVQTLRCARSNQCIQVKTVWHYIHTNRKL